MKKQKTATNRKARPKVRDKVKEALKKVVKRKKGLFDRFSSEAFNETMQEMANESRAQAFGKKK